MRKILMVSLCTALLAFGGRSARADEPKAEVSIKLGTLAPSGSPWHLLLKEAAQKWRQVSGGRVELKVLPGGTMGDEGEMIRKLRVGLLQAAAISTIGLHVITPEPQALDLPLLVNNDEEHEYLMQKMAPQLDALLEKKGFVVLTWSEIGNTHFFSTKPRPTLTDMRGGKLFCWDGDPSSAEAWRAGGFNTVPLSSTDIVPSMQTGLIDTVLYPPTLVLSLRINDKAKYMTDIKWSTLTGATIVDKKVWDRVPADLRPQLIQVFKDLGQKLTTDARRMESESMAKMKSQGLQEVKVADMGDWQKMLESVNSSVRGKVVPAATFDQVHQIVKDFRAQKQKK